MNALQVNVHQTVGRRAEEDAVVERFPFREVTVEVRFRETEVLPLVWDWLLAAMADRDR